MEAPFTAVLADGTIYVDVRDVRSLIERIAEQLAPTDREFSLLGEVALRLREIEEAARQPV